MGMQVISLATSCLQSGFPDGEENGKTIIRGDDVRTGVIAILPHSGYLFREEVPSAVSVGNTFGTLAGSTQVKTSSQLDACCSHTYRGTRERSSHGYGLEWA